jgi:hypothetical protein
MKKGHWVFNGSPATGNESLGGTMNGVLLDFR